MEETAGRILKGDNVKFEGQLHLDACQVPAGVKQGLSGNKNVSSAVPQARIVEEQDEFAVIEIICSCGTKTSVRCEYVAAKLPADQTK